MEAQRDVTQCQLAELPLVEKILHGSFLGCHNIGALKITYTILGASFLYF